MIAGSLRCMQFIHYHSHDPLTIPSTPPNTPESHRRNAMPFHNKPAFDDLPLNKTGPPGNAWGLFGPNDQCGMLNLLTPDRTCAAASEIRDGVRISTDWPLDRISTPAFDRIPFTQTISNIAPTSVNDDILHFNTQASSQWDGLRHFGYQKQRLYFNGRTLDDILTTKVNGIHGAYFHPKIMIPG